MGTDETGLLFQVRLPQPLRSATLSYKYKFSSGYDWTSGGKLPGLCDEGTALALISLAPTRFEQILLLLVCSRIIRTKHDDNYSISLLENTMW